MAVRDPVPPQSSVADIETHTENGSVRKYEVIRGHGLQLETQNLQPNSHSEMLRGLIPQTESTDQCFLLLFNQQHLLSKTHTS